MIFSHQTSLLKVVVPFCKDERQNTKDKRRTLLEVMPLAKFFLFKFWWFK